MIKDFGNFKKSLFDIINTVSAKGSVLDVLHIGEDKKTRTVVKTDVEKVKNIDLKVIELTLKSSTEQVDPTAGFLIEVYASGSDGRLTRLYMNDVVDLHGKVIEEGFSRYLILEIDK